MLKIRILLLWCLVALLFAVFSFASTFSPSYRKCIGEYSETSNKQNQFNSPVADGPNILPLFMQCEAKFIDENNGTVTALATIAIAGFTLTLWLVASNELQHTREIERAYLSGGGPVDFHKSPHQFVLMIQNYGKTPAYLHQFAVEIDTLTHVQANKPAYMSATYQRRSFDDSISPNAPMKAIWRVDISVPDPVAYGRFWYRDIWKDEHYFSFILPLYKGNDHSSVATMDPEYKRDGLERAAPPKRRKTTAARVAARPAHRSGKVRHQARALVL